MEIPLIPIASRNIPLLPKKAEKNFGWNSAKGKGIRPERPWRGTTKRTISAVFICNNFKRVDVSTRKCPQTGNEFVTVKYYVKLISAT